jgi:hypothetical protein
MTTMDTGVTLALPIPNAEFIWYCAWTSFFSAIYAFSKDETAHFTAVPAAVLASSLNYWRNPVSNSWRRTIDIAVVFSGMTYQAYYLHNGYSNGLLKHSTWLTYVYLIGCSAVCYGLGHYLMFHDCVWPATYAHASIHIVANTANFVLYNGYNTPK